MDGEKKDEQRGDFNAVDRGSFRADVLLMLGCCVEEQLKRKRSWMESFNDYCRYS